MLAETAPIVGSLALVPAVQGQKKQKEPNQSSVPLLVSDLHQVGLHQACPAVPTSHWIVHDSLSIASVSERTMK